MVIITPSFYEQIEKFWCLSFMSKFKNFVAYRHLLLKGCPRALKRVLKFVIFWLNFFEIPGQKISKTSKIILSIHVRVVIYHENQFTIVLS